VFFECVGFSYVFLDLVCLAILPSDWLAEPCPNDAYVEEFFHYVFRFFFTVLVVHPHHDHFITTVLTRYSPMA